MTAQVMTTEEIRANRAVANSNISVGMLNKDSFDLSLRIGKMLADSPIVPKDYQNNVPNCVIALNMSQRIGADVLMVMQNLVPIHGKPSWSSKFLIATFNSCGRFTAIRYEFFGEQGTDGWGCRAWAIERETGEKIVGPDITIALSKSEGWYAKNGSKWKSIPQLMLQYRSAAWLVNTYAPELAMGLSTVEETVDAQIIDVTPMQTTDEVVEKTEQTVDNIRKARPAKTKAETVPADVSPEPEKAKPAPVKTKAEPGIKISTEPKLEPTVPNEPAGFFDDEVTQAQPANDPERVAKVLESIEFAKTAAAVDNNMRYTQGLNDADLATIKDAIAKRNRELMATPIQTEKPSLKARMEACTDSNELGILSSEIEFLDPAIQQAMWTVYDECLNKLNA